MDTEGRSHMLISSGCKRVKSYYLEPFWFEKTAYRDFCNRPCEISNAFVSNG